MDLQPTRTEARRIVACLMTFWVVGGVLELGGLYDSAIGTAMFLGAFGAGIVLFWTIYSVAGRETGRTVWSFMGFRRPRLRGADSIWKSGAEGWRVTFKLMDPRWYARVVRTTGWNVILTGGALLAAFILILFTAVHSFTPPPPVGP
jgi:hypothetical protein